MCGGGPTDGRTATAGGNWPLKMKPARPANTHVTKVTVGAVGYFFLSLFFSRRRSQDHRVPHRIVTIRSTKLAVSLARAQTWTRTDDATADSWSTVQINNKKRGAKRNETKRNKKLLVFTLEMTMMGTIEAWKVQRSCIGASGLSSRARPSEKQTRKDPAATALPPPALKLLPKKTDTNISLYKRNKKTTNSDDGFEIVFFFCFIPLSQSDKDELLRAVKDLC